MINHPIFFERNRVGRVYTGGLLLDKFFGDEPKDGFFPEEWIASAVKAINKIPASKNEGLSKCKDYDIWFDELLAKYPSELLGSSQKMRILVKFLDSAVRLPAQAHPDKEFSKKHFNSQYGKTESWIVLDTRPGAKIYFGFKDGVTKEIFDKAIELSENDKTALENLMEYRDVKKGDMFLVPAKTVHAIGAGCLILEIQEPTDFTIQPEYWCDKYKLNHDEMYIGLSKEDALECFDFEKAPDTRLKPKIFSSSDAVIAENIVGPEDTECFVINRITIKNGSFCPNINDSYGVYIVTDGNGTISAGKYSQNISKGDYFFMPACLMGTCSINGTLEIVECY
ncbi:MAG: class I mannose-6-phosphate isomerase [Clostridia bacterium]|nr:class I mannose-6-phosphate isomerase [Clostridia bacterium]